MSNTTDPGHAGGWMPGGLRAANTPRHVEWSTDVENWMDKAACQGHHPKAYHRGMPDADRSVLEWIEGDPRTKKKYCNGGQLRERRMLTLNGETKMHTLTTDLPACPVRDKCLKRALEMTPLPAHGVWGGLDPDELRAKAREERALTVVPVQPKPRGVKGPDCVGSYGAKRHRKKGELPCLTCVAFETEQQKRARDARKEARQKESA